MNAQLNIGLSEFEILFRTHYKALCGYANGYLNDLAASEETVQALFVKIWENRDALEIEKSAKAYLYRATRNACFNHLRHFKIRDDYKKQYEQNRADEQFTVAEEYEGNELNAQIEIAIERLPEGRKKIFKLSRFEGLKYKEIADELNISIKTVENQMGSAIKQLRIELSDYLIILTILLFTSI